MYADTIKLNHSRRKRDTEGRKERDLHTQKKQDRETRLARSVKQPDHTHTCIHTKKEGRGEVGRG